MTDGPSPLTVDPDGIPPDLRATDRWLVWRTEDRGGKPTKIPYQSTAPGRKAKATDPDTWSSYQAAAAALEAHPDLSGLGFALGDGWAGVDLDDCRDPDTGEIDPWAQDLVDRLGSYTEVSPSGTGLKVFLRGRKPGDHCRTPVGDGEVEVYDSGRYFTVTGHHLEGTPATIYERTDALREVYADLFGSSADEEPEDQGPPSAAASRLTDEELLDRAREARNGDKFRALYDEGDTEGYPSRSEADQALCNLLAFWTGKDPDRMDRLFRGSALMRDKWDREDYRTRTLETAVARCQEVYEPGDVSEDYWAYLPQHRYVYRPTRELWPAASVNARIPPVPLDEEGEEAIPANRWLDRHRAVQMMTWAPGEPEVVEGRITTEGGWTEVPGTRTYNLYRAPDPEPGDPAEAGPWLEHLGRLYPEHVDHLVAWFAHRVQRPGEKINHAVVLGGGQGIGKDTLLEPVRYAIGTWNLGDISPTHLLADFNPWIKSVVLVVSEARDLGDMNRYTLYEKTKTLTAAPPDMLAVNEKYKNQYRVPNVVGVVFTTNHRDGLFLPPEDRRHFVAWSEATKTNLGDDYFRRLWSWYQDGGQVHVAAYLTDYDLSAFDPKEPPPKTDGWKAMVGAHRPAETDELATVLERLDWPPAVTKPLVEYVADQDLQDWLEDRSNYAKFRHRMEDVGYVQRPNPNESRGRWKVDGRQTTAMYVRQDLTPRQRLQAAEELSRNGTTDLRSKIRTVSEVF